MTVSIARRFSVGAAALVLCAATSVFAASQAGAGSQVLVVNPTTVAAGGQITVSQGLCSRTEVNVGVYDGWSGAFVTPTTDPIVSKTGIAPDQADQWTATLTIPEGTAPGSYTVYAECTDPGSEVAPWKYGAVELTVLPAAMPSTTTPTTTTPSSTTEPATKAATAVAGKPTYTG